MSDARPQKPARLSEEDRRHFGIIAEIAKHDAGLVISPEKAPMVFARLSKRLRALNLPGAGAYCDLVTGPAGADERKNLVSALTTNVTSFFREAHHFDHVREHVIPDLKRKMKRGERIRLWSAGCSNGSEPYSLAMTVLHALPNAADYDLRILATDIDGDILNQARAGRYAPDKLDPLPPGFLKRFFQRPGTGSQHSDDFEVRPEIKRLISFRELNLLGQWPMRHAFDAIFCRNVVIYFDPETQARLWARFEAACKPGAHLFIGHSERLPPSGPTRFEQVGTTTYRKHTASGPQRGDGEDT